ncbi:MAG: cytochrome c [Mangrovicoccus sp.]|nr:cytochrome c [Mangrovicoccus sp.]
MRPVLPVLALVLASVLPGLAPAQDMSMNVAARQGEMDLMAVNLGVLGAMAKGTAPYDATANIVAVSSIDQGLLWPEGTSNAEIKDTKALPAIWEKRDEFMAKWDDFGDAASTMLAAAGNGQEALATAMNTLGGACTACHKAFRQPDK